MSEYSQRPTNRGQAAAPRAAGSQQAKKSTSNANLGVMHYGVGLLLFAITVIGISLVALFTIGLNRVDDNDRVNEGEYQAVFLSEADGLNNQVYFGQLKAVDENTYRLSDVYYLQVTSETDANGEAQITGRTLAKRGNSEIYGPADPMYINRDKVHYWENIRSDSLVTCAVRDFQIANPDIYGTGIVKDQACEDDSQPAVDPNAGAEAPAPSTQPASPAAGTQPAGTPQVDDTPAGDPDVIPTP